MPDELLYRLLIEWRAAKHRLQLNQRMADSNAELRRSIIVCLGERGADALANMAEASIHLTQAMLRNHEVQEHLMETIFDYCHRTGTPVPEEVRREFPPRLRDGVA